MTFRPRIQCKFTNKYEQNTAKCGPTLRQSWTKYLEQVIKYPVPLYNVDSSTFRCDKNNKTNIVRRGMGRKSFMPVPIYFVHDCLNKKLIMEDGKWNKVVTLISVPLLYVWINHWSFVCPYLTLYSDGSRFTVNTFISVFYIEIDGSHQTQYKNI